jgi:hypothetical protein
MNLINTIEEITRTESKNPLIIKNKATIVGTLTKNYPKNKPNFNINFITNRIKRNNSERAFIER